MKVLLWALSWLLAAVSGLNVSPWPVVPARDEQETIRRTVPWSGSGDPTLEVSNIIGSIRVVAYDGRNVEMVADRTIHADSDDAVSEAKRNVRLEVTEDAGLLRICADAERCGCGINYRDRWQADRYRVDVNFDLRVPRNTILKVCTINHGAVTIDGTAGDFDVRNVNGGIEMTGVRGSGRAETVNGRVHATFAANPKTASSFKTINGEIEVTFPRDLAADLKLKTFNGGLYTDFDVVALPPAAPVAERRNGRTVLRSNRFAAVRVGPGGPELTFEGFNGDVRVLRANK